MPAMAEINILNFHIQLNFYLDKIFFLYSSYLAPLLFLPEFPLLIVTLPCLFIVILLLMLILVMPFPPLLFGLLFPSVLPPAASVLPSIYK